MSRQLGLRVYLIAALLGNSPLMFLVLLLTFEPAILFGNQPFFQALFFSVMFVGAALSSYLLVGRFIYRPHVIGLATGSLSYVVFFVYNVFLYREYMVLGGSWPVLAFISGGIVGGLLRDMVRKRRRRSPHS